MKSEYVLPCVGIVLFAFYCCLALIYYDFKNEVKEIANQENCNVDLNDIKGWEQYEKDGKVYLEIHIGGQTYIISKEPYTVGNVKVHKE